MEHSDWLKIVMGLRTANQIGLSQHSIALKFVYDISSRSHFLCLRIFYKDTYQEIYDQNVS